ncbi:MAG TPA: hypothetical protein EYH06_03220 [Chromatiales bacterium]|nr:hypothetical protein [Thiotrichales bacterium]HIP67581.1 hypothetical protein [Chromatiales bacterium]
MSDLSAERSSPHSGKTRRWFAIAWRNFCRLVVKVFYRKFEISGTENIPDNVGIIFCANHVNALADAVVLQAATEKAIRPLARSGLFENRLFKPLLDMIGAVPIYRRKDKDSDVSRNEDSFRRVYELLGENQALIIFPEGQSHDAPHLSELKTGAARMALGAIEVNGVAPVVLPVGLTFTGKGKFRSGVLVQFGEPVDLSIPEKMDNYDAVHLITDRIKEGLTEVTLNAESWEDINLMGRLEQFFALRHGKYHHRSLKQRFRTLQRLIEAQHLLRVHEPDRVRSLITHLKNFERLCRYCGVRDYHLTIKYQPALIGIYIVRTVFILIVALPVGLWGVINSIIPFELTRHLAKKIAKGTDQYDTTKMLLGMLLFTVFWGLQIFFVFKQFGLEWAMAYLISLMIGAAVALRMRGENKRIRENLKVFFIFLRKRQLKEYLQNKQHELEVELAKLVRIANRLSVT